MTKLLLILMVVGNIGEVWSEESSLVRNKTKGIWKDGKKIWEDGRKMNGEFWINVKWDSLGTWVETDDELREGNSSEDEVFRGFFTYDDGLWNGLGVIYWKNGNKRGEGLYEDGKHEGYYKKFYSSGKLAWKGNYEDGKFEGKRTDYYESGKVKLEINFKNGKLDGKWVSYYEIGKVGLEGNYLGGKKEGKWFYYNEEENIIDEDIWKYGECVEMCEGDEDD